MKAFLVSLLCYCNLVGLAQIIPKDSLYLGQIPPDTIPVEFKLYTSEGCKAVERIAISKDGTRLFYHENNGYEKTSIGRIRYYFYENKRWNGSFILFEVGSSPALSISEDSLYLQIENKQYYCVWINETWSSPNKFNSTIDYWHYLQLTNSGTYYASMKNAQGMVGKKDWSKITTSKKDTLIQSMGKPINSENENMDFYISKDESYIIFASDRTDIVKYGYLDLFISFRNKDGSWTIPQNLGKSINIPNEARWGPYVSPDNKYLFYSRSSKYDNSDACTNWVRIDLLVKRLKKSCR